MNHSDIATDTHSLRSAADAGDLDATVRLGQLLLQQGRYGSREFDEAVTRLEQAAERGHTGAQLLIAHLLVQVHALPDADARAARWYRAAADSGHPEAQVRIADMYLTGRGVGADDRKALSQMKLAASQCYPQLQCDLAYMLDHGIGCDANPDAATGWFLRALAQGSHQAAFALGLRFAAGVGVGRDPVVALACFDCAAGGGFPESDILRDRQVAVSSPDEIRSAADLAGRIRAQVASLAQRFSDAGITDNVSSESEMRRMTETIAKHWSALGEDRLSLDSSRRTPGNQQTDWPVTARPALPEPELWQPRVFRMPQFLSDYERAHLIATTAPRMAAAENFSRDAAQFEKDFFTGTAARLGSTLCDPVIRNIERRIARAAMLPVAHIEPLSVLRYRGDDSYHAHVDYLTPDRLKGAHGGQRLVTFICYLRAPARGGETEYLSARHAVTGRPGLALMHYNCLPDGEPDEASLHASRPVLAGEKWLLRTAIHAHSLYDSLRSAESNPCISPDRNGGNG
jgi:hypothetical protein